MGDLFRSWKGALMSDAISVFYYVFNKIYNFLFNQAFIEEGVSIGWIFVTVVIFGLIIRSILNIPNGFRSRLSKSSKSREE